MTVRYRLSIILGCVSVTVLVSGIVGAAGKRPIKNPKFDPNAKHVELFEGIENGTLKATMIPQNSLQGNILVENKTKEPVTVQLPESFVGVQVLKQFGIGGGGLGGGIGGGLGGGLGGGGGAQSVGGGGGDSGDLGGLGGEFSIPPEQIVVRPYKSVCLEHGKAEPMPRMRYRVVPTDKYTQNPELQQLLRYVAKLNPAVAQAAAWHLANGMSWQRLATKQVHHLAGRPATPYFSDAQIFRAQQVVALVRARVIEQAKISSSDPAPEQTPVRRHSPR